MEGTEDKTIEKRNGFSLTKLIEEHLTVLDLSNRNLKTIEKNVKFPINLMELNLSHNFLSEVPVSVINLEKIEVLNLSHNYIYYFDDIPKFCETIQRLHISNNNLLGPPYWIWSESTKNLTEINLSCNINITKSFKDGYYEELLEYKSRVTNIIIYNCKLNNHIELLGTFTSAKSIVLGTPDLSYYSLNNVEEVPCKGIDKCCDIEYLNLSNTNIYYVNTNIDIYKNLIKINLSYNNLDTLPEQFCLLENLEICILSYNSLYSLPANFCNLCKLTNLSVDSNELYTLPDNICKLPKIRRLDIYNNYLYEVPDGIENILEIDLACNYFEEPTDTEYLEKKKRIRENNNLRLNGRKVEDLNLESDHSNNPTDEEILSNNNDNEDTQNRSLSSPEDWDSDDYWIPHTPRQTMQLQSPWLFYVKRKINEGNFCPIDAHPISIGDQVRYEKMCNPKVEYESDGQFDDFSGDDS